VFSEAKDKAEEEEEAEVREMSGVGGMR